ncbi:MAG: helix-turn-helix domain-containing protein [Gemmatimonadota bacterium]|nr:helix-turn-helix domain-containing protein [Gemmatimonadota bacterium]
MVEVSSNFRFIGQGVYSVAEAGRLTGVSVENLRRWARGYHYQCRGEKRYSPPIIGTGLTERDQDPILEFRDIIEARFLAAFRKAGVSWRVIRMVAAKVHGTLEQTHPFATRIFRTDGRTILLQLISDDEMDNRLVDLLHDQYEWDRVVGDYLVEEKVEFRPTQEPIRWWPLGQDRQVVVDPARAFGAPIVSDEGVQTYLLAKAVGIEGDVDFVAHWYSVKPEAVRDAVTFETGLRPAL